MRHPVAERIKKAVRPSLYRLFRRGKSLYECPVCHYCGPFKDKKVGHREGMKRLDSKCPSCTATERHRMLSMLIEDVFAKWNTYQKSILHFAPEACLQTRLKQLFATYKTADLFMPGVDYVEDIQKLSFTDGQFDCVLISAVMSSVPDMETSLREIRRILAPGGIALIAEGFTLEETEEYPEQRGDFHREVGMDVLKLLGTLYQRVDVVTSNQYDERHGLINQIQINEIAHDEYPEAIRVPGRGYHSMVAVCHV